MKREWTPTAEAFRRFLTWLDEGVESDGQKYLEMRRRLILYFDRKNCPTPGELADETLDRVSRKLDEQGSITNLSPAHYCYITAKFVFLEHLRQAQDSHASVEELARNGPKDDLEARPADPEPPTTEALLASLEACLEKLAATDRQLILEYYCGEGRTKIARRRETATRLGISANALSVRACRIRSKVEDCVRGSGGKP